MRDEQCRRHFLPLMILYIIFQEHFVSNRTQKALFFLEQCDRRQLCCLVDFSVTLSCNIFLDDIDQFFLAFHLVVECPDPVYKSIGTFTFSLCLGRTDLAEFQLDTKIFKKRSNPGMNFTFTARDGWYYVKKMDKLNREFDHLINLVP